MKKDNFRGTEIVVLHPIDPVEADTGYTHVIGDDDRKVAEQLGEFFAQVRLNLPKYKNGSRDLRS